MITHLGVLKYHWKYHYLTLHQYLSNTSYIQVFGLPQAFLSWEKIVIASFSVVVAIEGVGLLFSRVRNFGDWEIAYSPLHFRVRMCETKSLWSCGGLEFSWDCWHQELATHGRCKVLWCPRKSLERRVKWEWWSWFETKHEETSFHCKAKASYRSFLQHPVQGTWHGFLWRDRFLPQPYLQSPISWENSRAVRKMVNIVMKRGKRIIAKTELLGQRWKRKPD